jgi:hypothetical protein
MSSRPAKVTILVVAAVCVIISATAAVASTSADAPKVDVQTSVVNTTLTDESKVGDSYIVYFTAHDNVSKTDGDGSGQCVVATANTSGVLVSRCLTILRLPAGEITLNGMFTRIFPVTYKAAVLGGTGAFKGISGEAELTSPEPKTLGIKINT